MVSGAGWSVGARGRGDFGRGQRSVSEGLCRVSVRNSAESDSVRERGSEVSRVARERALARESERDGPSDRWRGGRTSRGKRRRGAVHLCTVWCARQSRDAEARRAIIRLSLYALQPAVLFLSLDFCRCKLYQNYPVLGTG